MPFGNLLDTVVGPHTLGPLAERGIACSGKRGLWEEKTHGPRWRTHRWATQGLGGH